MLKLTYTETGLYLERLTEPLEACVTRRMLLALRLGQNFHIEKSRAAFMLPANAAGLALLEQSIWQERSEEMLLHRPSGINIALYSVDIRYVEVSLAGAWIAADVQAHEGMFVTVLGDRIETILHKLWQVAQDQISFLAG